MRKMHLVAYMKTGPSASYPSGWRHPTATLDDIFEPARWEHIARVLEAGFFDACFFADGLGLPDLYKGRFDEYVGPGGQLSLLDPMVVLPLMARVTSRLGLGATLSTTFHNPYNLARSLGSLDLLSKGRVAWNVVTTAREFEALNCGTEGLPPKELRYDRADEILEACFALWDGWDADALVMDKASGVFADPTKIRYANYQGKYVASRGPLSIPRSPQGRPVIMQAGSSERGRRFAARWAEMIFCSPPTKAAALAYRADIRARMDAIGRNPDECTVLPTLSLVLGETSSIAREKAAHIESLVDPDLVLAANSWSVAADLSVIEDEHAMVTQSGNQGVQGHRDRVLQTAKAKGITFAEAVRKPRDLLAGTPAEIADIMEDWYRTGACDGFIIPPTTFPTSFEEVATMLVPELQRRGLFRKAYAGATLRENLRNPG